MGAAIVRLLYAVFLVPSSDRKQTGFDLRLTARVLLCVLLLLIHYFLIFLPLSELFIIYILFFNPRWFRAFLNRSASRDTDSKKG